MLVPKAWVYLCMWSLLAGSAFAQNQEQAQPSVPAATGNPQKAPAGQSIPVPAPKTPAGVPAGAPLQQQPKRILGVMPNYRAVSAGAIPPPPTPKEAFKIATQNSFDYSSFVFVGITSLMAWGVEWPHDSPAHPELGSNPAGYARYYWRGFLDKADGNYMVLFVLPTLFHEDERYYAKGEGGFWKRTAYAVTRILITPNYQGHNTINAAEIFGRGISQGISAAYYPAQDRTAGALATKCGWAMGRDALTNVVREFWPDISAHVLHRHRK
jgi:hypothetical protein